MKRIVTLVLCAAVLLVPTKKAPAQLWQGILIVGVAGTATVGVVVLYHKAFPQIPPGHTNLVVSGTGYNLDGEYQWSTSTNCYGVEWTGPNGYRIWAVACGYGNANHRYVLTDTKTVFLNTVGGHAFSKKYKADPFPMSTSLIGSLMHEDGTPYNYTNYGWPVNVNLTNLTVTWAHPANPSGLLQPADAPTSTNHPIAYEAYFIVKGPVSTPGNGSLGLNWTTNGLKLSHLRADSASSDQIGAMLANEFCGIDFLDDSDVADAIADAYTSTVTNPQYTYTNGTFFVDDVPFVLGTNGIFGSKVGGTNQWGSSHPLGYTVVSNVLTCPSDNGPTVSHTLCYGTNLANMQPVFQFTVPATVTNIQIMNDGTAENAGFFMLK